MEKLSDIFHVSYWTKFDLNKMEICEDDFSEWINFISRTSQNNWIVAKVKKIKNKEPLKAWQITVSLWWSFVLSAFLQIEDFYTAQNVAILTPKFDLSERELFYYCLCITKNRFRYWAFWREANSSLKDILIPSRKEIPKFIYNSKIPDYSNIKKSLNNQKIDLKDKEYSYFKMQDLFEITTDPFISISQAEETPWKYPFISTWNKNNWGACFTWIESWKVYPAWCITIASSWNAWETFYQWIDFKVTNMITILKPKFTINKFIGLFLVSIIRKEKYRYSYGRKFWIDRAKNTKIKLPVDKDWNPDRKFMEDYIQSLPYSSSL